MSPMLLTGEDVNLTLRDLTVPLFRRRRVWTLTFLCVFAVAALIGLLRRQTYESHMSILISRAGLRPAEATEAKSQTDNPTPPLTDQEVNSEAESLKRHEFLERVVLTNGLQNGQDNRLLSLPSSPANRNGSSSACRAATRQADTGSHPIEYTPDRGDLSLNRSGSGLWSAEQPWQPLPGPAHPSPHAGLLLDVKSAITGLRSGYRRCRVGSAGIPADPGPI